jgi:hypothetical protein
MLFFEKKNQKTFVCLVPRQVMPATTEVNTAQAQKFLVLFFKKTLLPTLALANSPPAPPAKSR